MEELHAILMDIKKLAVHDGPGIRTTVFLKGCPLHCQWCHNPEGISSKAQLAYYRHKCLSCGECTKVCPYGAHSFESQKHTLNLAHCAGCGACEKVCLGDALHLFGTYVTPEEIVQAVEEDALFYRVSGGGMTFSGGEPLLQADFCAAVAKQCKEKGISVAVDTCGCVPFEAFEKLLPYTDIFLYDIKHIDSAEHKRYTGVGNELILENLRKLDQQNTRIEIRIPLIPGCNNHPAVLDGIGHFLAPLHIEKIRVLPYHSMAKTKYLSLDMDYTMPDVASPTDEELNAAVEILKKYDLNAISGRS